MALVPVNISVGWVNLCYWIRLMNTGGPDGPARAWFFPGDCIELSESDARIIRRRLADFVGTAERVEVDAREATRDVPPGPTAGKTE